MYLIIASHPDSTNEKKSRLDDFEQLGGIVVADCVSCFAATAYVRKRSQFLRPNLTI